VFKGLLCFSPNLPPPLGLPRLHGPRMTADDYFLLCPGEFVDFSLPPPFIVRLQWSPCSFYKGGTNPLYSCRALRLPPSLSIPSFPSRSLFHRSTRQIVFLIWCRISSPRSPHFNHAEPATKGSVLRLFVECLYYMSPYQYPLFPQWFARVLDESLRKGTPTPHPSGLPVAKVGLPTKSAGTPVLLRISVLLQQGKEKRSVTSCCPSGSFFSLSELPGPSDYISRWAFSPVAVSVHTVELDWCPDSVVGLSLPLIRTPACFFVSVLSPPLRS